MRTPWRMTQYLTTSTTVTRRLPGIEQHKQPQYEIFCTVKVLEKTINFTKEKNEYLLIIGTIIGLLCINNRYI